MPGHQAAEAGIVQRPSRGALDDLEIRRAIGFDDAGGDADISADQGKIAEMRMGAFTATDL